MISADNRNDLVLIIDGLNLFTRHFVAHPATGINGQHVGGIVGFLYTMIELIEKFKPEKIIIAWEGGGSKKRRDLYSDYKQKRKPAKLNRYYDDDLPDTLENRNHQISVLIKVISNIPVNQIYVPDCEADDVIGYISRYTFNDRRKLIVSSDRDFYQLLDKLTIIYSPTWKKLVTANEVIDKFGISPENFCLAKTACGDPSDNINGVKGIGFKTLSKRFPELGSNKSISIKDLIETCEKMIDAGSKIKSIRNLVESKELLERNWKLMYLDTSNLSGSQIIKINNIIDEFEPDRDKLKIMKILISEGIQTFNIDRMFFSLSYVG